MGSAFPLSEPSEIREHHRRALLFGHEAPQRIDRRSSMVLGLLRARERLEREHGMRPQHAHLQALAMRGALLVAGRDTWRVTLSAELEPKLTRLRVAHGNGLQNGADAPIRQQARARSGRSGSAKAHHIEAHGNRAYRLLVMYVT